MPSLPILFVSLCGLFAASAFAQTVDAAVDLAKANGCYSCHANAEKVVGPAYSAVAEKYAGDKDAAASLVQSIKYGSKGKWGRIPMPAHASMSDADLKTLANWVLTVKP
ncbi:c-type cytochrome [Hydrogenophaga sp.]|uniref:c-type cytochrome n=1 Tax=Hydrogenophaga sp. TaxID=1904254 RepID=UPI003569ECF7